MNPENDRCLALAGVFQAAFLVQRLARVGEVQPDSLQTSLHSVLRIEANDVEAVFDGASGLGYGLSKLAALQVSQANPGTVEAMRYVLSLLVLTDHLAADEAVVRALTTELSHLSSAQQQQQQQQATSAPLVEELADLYIRHLSAIKPKIVVNGERHLLREQSIIDTVRACLLAGVRAAWLWYQLGGNRWHLLFFRGRYIRQAGAILAQRTAVDE